MIYAIYRDGKKFAGGHIEIMLFIEIAKLELTGSHVGTMLFIQIAKVELTGGHIGICYL